MLRLLDACFIRWIDPHTYFRPRYASTVILMFSGLTPNVIARRRLASESKVRSPKLGAPSHCRRLRFRGRCWLVSHRERGDRGMLEASTGANVTYRIIGLGKIERNPNAASNWDRMPGPLSSRIRRG